MLSFLKMIGWLRLSLIGAFAALGIAHQVFGLEWFGPEREKLQRLALIGMTVLGALLILVAAIAACLIGWQLFVSKRALDETEARLRKAMDEARSPEAERAKQLLRERASKDR
jgi:uncharacterized membrane protein